MYENQISTRLMHPKIINQVNRYEVFLLGKVDPSIHGLNDQNRRVSEESSVLN